MGRKVPEPRPTQQASQCHFCDCKWQANVLYLEGFFIIYFFILFYFLEIKIAYLYGIYNYKSMVEMLMPYPLTQKSLNLQQTPPPEKIQRLIPKQNNATEFSTHHKTIILGIFLPFSFFLSFFLSLYILLFLNITEIWKKKNKYSYS